MLKVELHPDLSRCIETVARDEYERGLRTLLAGEGEQQLAERTELLRLFLETADFSDLRRRSEGHLLQGKEVAFTIYMEQGALRCDLQVS
jgi:hypothetical protein